MPDALLAAPVVAEDLGAQRMPRTRGVEPLYGTEQAVHFHEAHKSTCRRQQKGSSRRAPLLNSTNAPRATVSLCIVLWAKEQKLRRPLLERTSASESCRTKSNSLVSFPYFVRASFIIVLSSKLVKRQSGILPSDARRADVADRRRLPRLSAGCDSDASLRVQQMP